MFYYSGIVNGKYLKNEVKQLTLFISRVKVCAQKSSRTRQMAKQYYDEKLLVTSV
jgi:hypothetical protein